MSTTAGTLIDDVTADLHDAGNVRWSRADMLGWLNDGQREVVLFRPDASTAVVNIPLGAGTLQSLPATALRLMRVISNESGRACRNVPVDTLDDQRPAWRNDPASATVKSWAYDERTPKQFEVWPPAPAAGAALKAIVSVTPAECANEAASIALDDQYKGPLMSYIRYRCYLRDSEDAANAAMAAEAYGQFQNQLGVKTQSDMAVKPDLSAPKRMQQ